MSVQTQIDRLEAAKEAISTAIAGKGVTVPDGTMLDGMAALIESIEAGGGGELQYASGTVSVKSAGVLFSVTGLPFKPKIIFIYKTGTQNNNTTSKYLINGFVYTEESTACSFGLMYYQNSKAYSTVASGSAEASRFTITDDGFSVNHYGAQTGTYAYYVIG